MSAARLTCGSWFCSVSNEIPQRASPDLSRDSTGGFSYQLLMVIALRHKSVEDRELRTDDFDISCVSCLLGEAPRHYTGSTFPCQICGTRKRESPFV